MEPHIRNIKTKSAIIANGIFGNFLMVRLYFFIMLVNYET